MSSLAPADDIEPLGYRACFVGRPPPKRRDSFYQSPASSPRGGLVGAQCVRALSARPPRTKRFAPRRVGCGRPRMTTATRRSGSQTILIGGSRRRGSPSPPAGRAAVWSRRPKARSAARRGLCDGRQLGDHDGGRCRRSARGRGQDRGLRGGRRSLRERRGADGLCREAAPR